MATQNRTTLKSYFETGDIPTEAQFADLIDSATPHETNVDSSSGTISPDFSSTTTIYTLLQDISIIIGAPSGIQDGTRYSFVIEQDGAGGSEVTFHSSYKFPIGFSFSMPPNLGDIAVVEGYCHAGILYMSPAAYYAG